MTSIRGEAGGGVADDVRRHALGGQARTALASALEGLIE